MNMPEGRGARQAQVVAALQAVLPAHALLWQREDTVPYECDGLTAYRAAAAGGGAARDRSAGRGGAARPATRCGVPVVARGAGTGLSGGAMPHALGVTLSLAKFNRILQIDPVARTARRAVRRAQPGDQRGGGAATACTTRPTRRARSPAPSAATWPRTRAACTA